MDYRAWGREHPVRKWICIVLLIALGLYVLAAIAGESKAQAAGCGTSKSQVKHLETALGTNMTDTRLVVNWCWGDGKVKSSDEQVKNDWVNCWLGGWCVNWSVSDKGAGGYYSSPDHHKRIVYGHIEYCQDAPFGLGCVNREKISFGGWVKCCPAEDSFGTGFSGGGGGGSWKIKNGGA